MPLHNFQGERTLCRLLQCNSYLICSKDGRPTTHEEGNICHLSFNIKIDFEQIYKLPIVV